MFSYLDNLNTAVIYDIPREGLHLQAFQKSEGVTKRRYSLWHRGSHYVNVTLGARFAIRRRRDILRTEAGLSSFPILLLFQSCSCSRSGADLYQEDASKQKDNGLSGFSAGQEPFTTSSGPRRGDHCGQLSVTGCEP